MRERTRDSVRRPSSPSRPRDRDWDRIDQCDASSRCDRSPIRSGWDSRRLNVRRTEWEADVGGIRRDCSDSDPYEAERRRQDRFSKREREGEGKDDRWKKISRFRRGEFAEEVYPDRCESVKAEEKLRHGFKGAMRSEEELYRIPEAERSREIDNFVRPTLKQCWRDDLQPSRSISSHGYSGSVSPLRNAIRNDEVDWLGPSDSRHYSDMERLQMQSNQAGKHDERAESVFVGMKVESSDRNRRIDSRDLGCEGRSRDLGCEGRSRDLGVNASRVLHNRDLDRYINRNSSRGFQEDEAKSFHNCNYLQGRNVCCCVSSTEGKWRKDMKGASRESYCRDFCGDGYRMHMGQDPVHYTHMRGSLLKPRVMDSITNEVDRAGTSVGFCTGERISGLYDSIKEECVVERESSILVDQFDGARNYRKAHHEERKDAYLDNKTQHLRKDYQFDACATMYHDVNESDFTRERDERSLQFRSVYRNKGKETYPDNESQKVQNDYDFVSYERMYPDVNRSDVMIDRDERALQARRIYPKIDNESHHVQKDYEYDSYAKMYSNANGSNSMADQDERALQSRKRWFNEEHDAYLDNGSREVQKDYEYESYGRVYHDVSQPSSLMANRDEEIPQYRRYHLDGGRGTLIYLDDESAHLGKADQVNLHTSDRYSLKSHMTGETVYENISEVNYGDVEQTLTNEKPGSERFVDHDIAYDHNENQYSMGITGTNRIHYLDDERRSGHDDENHVSTSCPRIPVKQRLGGRVKDPSFHVKNRRGPGKKGLPWVRNYTPNRKFHGKN
ncbi:PREDICTED: uncharacterized protein LOC104810903 [Tarenaya hassleriana]|uniref:uncharacterized protein LOC104810903 n=1 Tax=Tarenaya hassleriana TaxID=28532 RepID=UPI0008FD569F|nr:PREDICTED: uncharacterized protein LOC104810903 [Tarenaya hassleriana]